MLRLAICDDDKPILDKLRVWISEYNPASLVSHFGNAEDLLEFLQNLRNPVDVLLCDIFLEQYSGIDISSKIKMLRPDLQIIFISGKIRHQIDVYRVEHIYFLPKPISKELLFDALNRCEQAINKTRKASVAVKTAGGIQSIFLHELDYIEQCGRISLLTFGEETVSTYSSLSVLLGNLDERFLQCHKSFAVNMDKVKKLETSEIVLQNGKTIPISRRYSEKAKQRFLQYVGGRI